MTRLIARTLQETVLLRLERTRVLPPASYSQFVEVLLNARNPTKVKNPIHSAIITLNYDLALDFALNWHNAIYSYGLDAQEFRPGDDVPPENWTEMNFRTSLG